MLSKWIGVAFLLSMMTGSSSEGGFHCLTDDVNSALVSGLDDAGQEYGSWAAKSTQFPYLEVRAKCDYSVDAQSTSMWSFEFRNSYGYAVDYIYRYEYGDLKSKANIMSAAGQDSLERSAIRSGLNSTMHGVCSDHKTGIHISILCVVPHGQIDTCYTLYHIAQPSAAKTDIPTAHSQMHSLVTFAALPKLPSLMPHEERPHDVRVTAKDTAGAWHCSSDLGEGDHRMTTTTLDIRGDGVVRLGKVSSKWSLKTDSFCSTTRPTVSVTWTFPLAAIEQMATLSQQESQKLTQGFYSLDMRAYFDESATDNQTLLICARGDTAHPGAEEGSGAGRYTPLVGMVCKQN